MTSFQLRLSFGFTAGGNLSHMRTYQISPTTDLIQAIAISEADES